MLVDNIDVFERKISLAHNFNFKLTRDVCVADAVKLFTKSEQIQKCSANYISIKKASFLASLKMTSTNGNLGNCKFCM